MCTCRLHVCVCQGGGGGGGRGGKGQGAQRTLLGVFEGVAQLVLKHGLLVLLAEVLCLLENDVQARLANLEHFLDGLRRGGSWSCWVNAAPPVTGSCCSASGACAAVGAALEVAGRRCSALSACAAVGAASAVAGSCCSAPSACAAVGAAPAASSSCCSAPSAFASAAVPAGTCAHIIVYRIRLRAVGVQSPVFRSHNSIHISKQAYQQLPPSHHFAHLS